MKLLTPSFWACKYKRGRINLIGKMASCGEAFYGSSP
jgi:hypothetical protein